MDEVQDAKSFYATLNDRRSGTNRADEASSAPRTAPRIGAAQASGRQRGEVGMSGRWGEGGVGEPQTFTVGSDEAALCLRHMAMLWIVLQYTELRVCPPPTSSSLPPPSLTII